MSFSDIMQRNHAFNKTNEERRRKRRALRKTNRQNVWNCADAVFLAVHEGRPQCEIDILLAELAIATGIATGMESLT